MAFFDTTWYVSSVKYAAVTARPQNAAVVAGQLVRQFTAPAVGSERVFVCTQAGTTANVTDATWNIARGGTTTDGTAKWQECTGQPAVNGDLTSTLTWAQVKAIGGVVGLGTVIKRNNGVSYQINTSGAGAQGASEPAFSDTAGVPTTDGATNWTSLGPVGNFPAWGAPHARLAVAYVWGAAGNKFFLADNHAETQATALTLTSPATAAGGPTYAICVDRTVSLPPVEANINTGAAIAVTSTNNIILNVSGSAATSYYQGISFSAGNTAAAININTATANYVFKNCGFVLAGAATANTIIVGSSSSSPAQILWDNCTVNFSHAGQSIKLQNAGFEWRNTASAIQGTVPTTLFVPSSTLSNTLICRGLDLSALSTTLVAPGSATPYVFEDCKFNASMTRLGLASSIGYAADPVVTVRCDSGATNYKATRDEYAGSQSTETSITRVGGATDGTTPTSIKIATNAQATFLTPYRMLRLATWSDVTGANQTVTVCGTINSASLPKNDEIWMDVQYLGSSGSPVASFKTTCKSHPLAANAAVSSDGSTWNGGGSGAGWSPFKLVATLTSPQPQMKGYVYASIRAAKASTIYYIDPQVTLS